MFDKSTGDVRAQNFVSLVFDCINKRENNFLTISFFIFRLNNT
jgi:hypothetical protein